MPTVITGTDGVSQVQAGAVESGDLPAGSVIQVVNYETTAFVGTTSNNTFIDYGIAASITPTSSSNTILIFFSLNTYHYGNQDSLVALRILRDNSEIKLYDQVSRIRAAPDGTTTLLIDTISSSYLDSPATTSEIVYSFEASHVSGSLLQLQIADTPSRVTLMEIAG